MTPLTFTPSEEGALKLVSTRELRPSRATGGLTWPVRCNEGGLEPKVNEYAVPVNDGSWPCVAQIQRLLTPPHSV